ncbi:hypothetical protein D0C36_17070 [Mucilaginibacter conchicola]|uniref:Uncharacterized protein n=1 Tax=Mucilaginibacter conchicola TaxID=2303333 RepID=A0A372NQM2_9SPHI|nr:hypothetical protein [Mucilaginibacter conchicola]RFZ90675.1 hypothetical protein D0C36_17070 [Mucilaginibacter conchicola]
MQPFVQNVPDHHAPSPPAGYRPGWFLGPETLELSREVPVLHWADCTYWAYSDIHNGDSLCIVAYDHDRNVVKKWEKHGVRYVWDTVLDLDKKMVTFWGQANERIEVSLDELSVNHYQRRSIYPPPYVTSSPFSQAPEPPAGFKSQWNRFNSDAHTPVPVLNWEDHTYRTYDHLDNRNAFLVVAYDKAGKIIGNWDVTGARYINHISVDEDNKQVIFHGQADATGSLSWNDIKIEMPDPKSALFDKYIHPVLKQVSQKAMPAAPAGYCYKWLQGPESGKLANDAIMIQWKDYSFYAYDSANNDMYIGIVGYDKDGKIVKQLTKHGTRYLYSILSDAVSRSIIFRGQSDTKAVVSWDELFKF